MNFTEKHKFIDDIEHVPLDVSIKENIENLWCRKLYNVEEIHQETQGENINVAVIDTGKPLHEDLIITEAVNLTNSNEFDLTGHATHISGIIASVDEKIYGIAPKCNLYTIKALDDNGQGDFETIYSAIKWCYENDIHVINLSLGSKNKPTNHEEYKEIIDKLVKKGVVICAAAGNTPGEYANYPAEYENVISVAAITRKKKIETWCNSDCDFVAPSSAYSCYLENKYARLRGTSQSTAFISGTVALIKSYYHSPYMSHEKIYELLKSISIPTVGCKNGMPQPNSIIIEEGERNDSSE